MRNEFSTHDISRVLGIARGRLREWVDLGFIIPFIPAEGRGTKAIFTRHDVYGIAIFRLLIGLGFTRQLAGEYVEEFIKEMGRNPSRKATHLLFKTWRDENEIFISCFNYAGKFDGFSLETAEVPDIRKQGMIQPTTPEINWETAFIINFKHIREMVDSNLNNL